MTEAVLTAAAAERLRVALTPGTALPSTTLETIRAESSKAWLRFLVDGQGVELLVEPGPRDLASPQLEDGGLLLPGYRITVRRGARATLGSLMAFVAARLSALGPIYETLPEPAAPAVESDPLRDTELLALRLGVKPALRRAVPKDDVDGAAARATAEGFVARRLGVLQEHDGVVCDILAIARDETRAERVLALERQMRALGKDTASAAPIAQALGEALGYPPCCVEAHVRRVAAGTSTEDAPFEAVREAQVEAPDWRLNDLLLGEGVGLVTFEPCRFDCRAALEYATPIATELGRRGALARLESKLAIPVGVSPRFARAELRLEGRVIVDARPIPAVWGQPPDAECQRFAARLVSVGAIEHGATEHGAIEHGAIEHGAIEHGEGVVVDFRHRRI
ncbi:MAG: hypothetical protein AAGF12_34125 [Myxococcota bacterium]